MKICESSIINGATTRQIINNRLTCPPFFRLNTGSVSLQVTAQLDHIKVSQKYRFQQRRRVSPGGVSRSLWNSMNFKPLTEVLLLSAASLNPHDSRPHYVRLFFLLNPRASFLGCRERLDQNGETSTQQAKTVFSFFFLFFSFSSTRLPSSSIESVFVFFPLFFVSVIFFLLVPCSFF
jgi:hypothetical protein